MKFRKKNLVKIAALFICGSLLAGCGQVVLSTSDDSVLLESSIPADADENAASRNADGQAALSAANGSISGADSSSGANDSASVADASSGANGSSTGANTASGANGSSTGAAGSSGANGSTSGTSADAGTSVNGTTAQPGTGDANQPGHASASGSGILEPSAALMLTAGSVLMEDSVDWNAINSYFAIYEIHEGDAVYNRIIGKSYQVNEHIGLADLRYLKVLHYNFDGNLQVGELICNASLAQDMIEIFRELLTCGYQICSMHLIDNYWTGDGVESDEASIENDNTSSFCYRKATDADNLSNHAYGRAIDINPLENPFYIIRPDGSLEYYHDRSAPYLQNRDPAIPHVITEVDDAYRIFTAHGFSWGGSWENPKDYQHFEKLT